MNDIVTLIYITTTLENGENQEVRTEKDNVFCEINSLSFEEQSRLQSANFREVIKCLINFENDATNLYEVIYKNTTYEIVSKDRFKSSDQVSLLLKERN